MLFVTINYTVKKSWANLKINESYQLQQIFAFSQLLYKLKTNLLKLVSLNQGFPKGGSWTPGGSWGNRGGSWVDTFTINKLIKKIYVN